MMLNTGAKTKNNIHIILDAWLRSFRFHTASINVKGTAINKKINIESIRLPVVNSKFSIVRI
jgi:hypothetical protein